MREVGGVGGVGVDCSRAGAGQGAGPPQARRQPPCRPRQLHSGPCEHMGPGPAAGPELWVQGQPQAEHGTHAGSMASPRATGRTPTQANRPQAGHGPRTPVGVMATASHPRPPAAHPRAAGGAWRGHTHTGGGDGHGQPPDHVEEAGDRGARGAAHLHQDRAGQKEGRKEGTGSGRCGAAQAHGAAHPILHTAGRQGEERRKDGRTEGRKATGLGWRAGGGEGGDSPRPHEGTPQPRAGGGPSSGPNGVGRQSVAAGPRARRGGPHLPSRPR